VTNIIVTNTGVIPQVPYGLATVIVLCPAAHPVATGGGASTNLPTASTDIVESKPQPPTAGSGAVGWVATVRNDGTVTPPNAYATTVTAWAICAP
jgi:hypothetical protein